MKSRKAKTKNEETNITKKDNKYNIIIVVPDTRTGGKKDSAAAVLKT